MKAMAVTNEATTYTQYQRMPRRRPSMMMKIDAAAATTRRSIDKELTAGFANQAEKNASPLGSTALRMLNHAVPTRPIAATARYSQKTLGGRVGGVEPPSGDAFMTRECKRSRAPAVSPAAGNRRASPTLPRRLDVRKLLA